jgi:phage/plasmid primase-like uncharacterized protein
MKLLERFRWLLMEMPCPGTAEVSGKWFSFYVENAEGKPVMLSTDSNDVIDPKKVKEILDVEKDIKAMHNPSYTIDSNMTANMGNAFLNALDTTQRTKITDLVTLQRSYLQSIVTKRGEIATELRKMLAEGEKT